MEKREFTFNSSNTINKIHCIKWIPEGEPLGIIQICHGMVEYIDRYNDFATYLCNKGFLVVGNDHLGHGDTANSPEEYGYFGDTGGNGFLVSDIDKLKAIICKEYGNKLPYILIGHSFGSLLVREYLVRFNTGIAGAIIIGTMNKNTFIVSIGKLLAKCIALFKGGKKYKSQYLDDKGLGVYNQPFEAEGLKNAWVCSDREVVEWYNQQEKCTFVFTTGGYIDLFDGILEVNKRDNLKRMNKKVPLLLLSGEKDPVGDMGKGVTKLYDTYNKLGIEDVQMKLYEEDRHEILNGINKQSVYDDIYQWITKVI